MSKRGREDEVSTGIRTWEDGVRNIFRPADIFSREPEAYGNGGYFITLAVILLRLRIFITLADFFYGCGYFIKGVENFVLDSM